MTKFSFSFLSLPVAVAVLNGCMTTKGNYMLKAVDANGNQLNKVEPMAIGSGIYIARNALCMNHPKAKIIITDIQTRQELAGESPYQCP